MFARPVLNFVSSTEVELPNQSIDPDAIRESVWIKGMLQELKLMKADDAIEVFEDNNACISIAENDGVSERVKHKDVKFHYGQEVRS